MRSADIGRTYKVALDAVCPEHVRESFQIGDNADAHERLDGCMVGFSLGNPQFTFAKVAAMAEWIEKRFKRCVILIGDNIYRLTLQIKEGLSEEEALHTALKIGRERMSEVGSIFGSKRNCHFTFAPCSEMASHPDYNELYRHLEFLYQDNANFAQSVEKFSGLFLNRQGREDEQHILLSKKYLFEEFAIMACAYRDGFRTFVYPGDLFIAREFSAGMHCGAPVELVNMTTVALRVKARKSASGCDTNREKIADAESNYR